MSTPPPGSGYFVAPTDGPGPGLLLLHNWWGLNRDAKDLANEFADAGFTVLAPDLADGENFTDLQDAHDALGRADMNVLASLVQSSVGIVRQAASEPSRPIGVVGLGSGASWALWLSARATADVAAVVTYYGSQTIGMEGSQAEYLCHWAEEDENVSDEDMAQLGLSLQLARREFRFEMHERTLAGFAEKTLPSYNAAAAAVAWRQSTEFLASRLAP